MRGLGLGDGIEINSALAVLVLLFFCGESCSPCIPIFYMTQFISSMDVGFSH